MKHKDWFWVGIVPFRYKWTFYVVWFVAGCLFLFGLLFISDRDISGLYYIITSSLIFLFSYYKKKWDKKHNYYD